MGTHPIFESDFDCLTAMVDSDEFETKSEDEDEDLCHVPQTQQQQQQQQIGPVLQQQQRKRYGESERPNGKKHKTEEISRIWHAPLTTSNGASNGSQSYHRRMKPDHIVDKRFKSAWKSVIKHLNFRDKYRLFNTSKFFRYTLDLTNHGIEEMETISGILQATPQDRSRCRSYRDPKWAFYRAFTWITKQNPNSKWTQWKFFFSQRRHPICLAILAKSEFIGELIENDRISIKPDEVGDYLNRPPQLCRELTESFGWYDIKRLSFYVHQESLHQGVKNYEKLLHGIMLKEDFLYVFTDVLRGERLHIVNLESEHIVHVDVNFNTLFHRHFAQCDFLHEIKNNKFIKTGAIVKKQVLLAINKLNETNWERLQIYKVKFEDAQKKDENVMLELIYYMKINVDGFPKVNFPFLATFAISSPSQVTISNIVNLGVRERVPLQKARLAQMSIE